jgi:hypothetical protein
VFVVMIDVVYDGGDQFDHISENSTPQSVRGEVAKETFDMFSHEALVGVKWM